jgi:hypothetical protein
VCTHALKFPSCRSFGRVLRMFEKKALPQDDECSFWGTTGQKEVGSCRDEVSSSPTNPPSSCPRITSFDGVYPDDLPAEAVSQAEAGVGAQDDDFLS